VSPDQGIRPAAAVRGRECLVLFPARRRRLEALPVDMTSADLDEVAEEDEDEEDKRAGHTRRWVAT